MYSALFVATTLCAVVRAFPNQTYVTENFTAPGLEIAVTGPTAPGYLFYGVIGSGYIQPAPIIMQNNGDLVWYGGENLVTHNMRLQSFEGDQVLTYWSGFTDSFGHGYGSISLFDNTYSTLYTVCLHANITTPKPNEYPGNTPNPCYFDGHESYLTDRGTVIGTAFNVTRTDLRQFHGLRHGWIFNALFYEVDVKTNEVLFSWSAKDHVPLSKSNYLGNDTDKPLKIGKTTYGKSQAKPWDYFHINSVQPVKGGYLVNSRMTWSCYMVNGKTGHVEWTLEGSNGGDFTLGPGIFWSWQHMPRVLSHKGDIMHISLFNNDNINSLVYGTNASTGYLLEVNTKTMHVTALLDLQDPADPVFTSAEGSYQALPNTNILMGYGSKAVFKEFDNAGNVLYNAAFAPLSNVNPDGSEGKDVHSYRTYRYPWTAQPTYNPKAAGIYSAANSNTTVYMSWNGATTYDSWNIYAGASHDQLLLVASDVPQKGFETSHDIADDGSLNYVQVEAIGGGQTLAFSDIVSIQSS